MLDLRLPRAWAAVLAGAGIGMTGLLLQTLFRNPLADPWVLDVVNGAGRGGRACVLGVVRRQLHGHWMLLRSRVRWT